MDKHVNITGILWIVYGGLGLIAAAIVVMTLLGVSFIVGISAGLEEGGIPIGVLTIVATVVGGILFITSVPEIVAGIWLLKYKEWARILTIILAILNLINIPLGTALGAYSLWVLFHKDAVPLFQKQE